MLLYQNIFTTIMSNYSNEVRINSAALAITGESNMDETDIIGLDSLLKHEGVQPSHGTDAVTKTTQAPVKYIRPAVSRQPGDVAATPSVPKVIAIDTGKAVAVAKDNSNIVAGTGTATAVATTSESKLIRYSLTH